MRQKIRKFVSGLLAIVMLISLLPIQTFAWTEEAKSTVYIPIVTSPEEEGMQPAVMSADKTPIYVSTAAMSTELPTITLESGISAEGARVQAIDSDGKIVAQTAGMTLYNSKDYISTSTMFMLETLPAGEYSLQLVYGDVESIQKVALNYVLKVVDEPVITYGYISDLTAGTATAELRLNIAGYKGNPDIYSFALMDIDGNIITCTAEHILTSERGYGVAQVTYNLTPQTTIVSGNMYYLQISVATGELYLNVSGISGTAYESYESEIAVLEIVPDEETIGGLCVTIGGVTENTEYTVVARIGSSYDGAILYEGALVPTIQNNNGIFKIILIKNDLQLPLEVYGSNRIYVTVTDANGASDTNYFAGSNNYVNQSAALTLEKTAENTYSFILQGRNVLLDLYEADTLNFTLRQYDDQTAQYQVVGTLGSGVEKSTYTSGGSVYFEFKGNFVTNEELVSGVNYFLYNNEESISLTRSINGLKAEEAIIALRWSEQVDYLTSSFYFNFGYCPIHVNLSGEGEPSSVQLYDKTSDEVVVTTDNVAGEWDSMASKHTFSFMLPQSEKLDATHTYEIRFITGEQIRTLWNDIAYESEVIGPTYYYVEEPIFEGDTKLTLRCSSGKNLSQEYFEANPFYIINETTEIGVQYTSITPYFNGSTWYLDLILSSPITMGSYTNQGYGSFEVYPAGATVLGDIESDETAKTILIADCYNLTAETYTAILYDTAENGHKKLADLVLTKTSDSILSVQEFPSGLTGSSYAYTLEIRADGNYLDTKNFYFSESDNIVEECMIVVYGIEETSYSTSYSKVNYQTDAEEIALSTNYPGYAYVRYSEDSSFTGVDYSPVRNYYNQNYTLSDGEGVKTIYVQFKNSAGTESRVYKWECQKVDSLSEPAIKKAFITVDGQETTIIPDNAEFVLNLISTSQLTSAYAEFVEANGYSTDYSLSYKGEVQGKEGGHLFQVTLDSSDYPFYYSDFTEVIFILTDLAGNTWNAYAEESISVYFGESGVILDAWREESTVYTNQSDYAITGMATPNSTITISWKDNSNELTATVVADDQGKFEVTLKDLPERGGQIYVTDSTGLENTENLSLIVDRTEPAINSLKAVLTEDGNGAVTWEYTECYLEYFLLYRDDVLIKGSASDSWKYTDTNYIAVNADGATFTVIAVDSAGNQSEAKSVTVGDSEPPSAPGTPCLAAHGTKSITFSWTAATDDVAVYQYEIYRDEEKIDTVSYKELSFCDSGLEEGKSYTYSVYALDHPGNRSEAAMAELSTAILKVDDSTEFLQEYIKESYEDGVDLCVVVNNSNSYYDVSKVTAKFLYKEETATEWSEIELSGNSTYKEGTWEIEDLPIGNYAVKFTVVDTEGAEEETAISEIVITQDTEAPIVSITKPLTDSVCGGSKAQDVTFSASDNVGVEKVELYYSVDNGVTFQKSTTITNERTYKETFKESVSFAEAATLASGEVLLKVVAYDKRDNEGTSEIISVTLDNTAPDVPSNFYVGGDKDKITVMWQYPVQDTNSDFEKFKVYRSTSAEGEFVCIKEIRTIGYYDTAEEGIKVATPYYYYVTAVDEYGNESVATSIQSGELVDDDVVPIIHSTAPGNSTTLQKTVTLKVSATDNYRLQKCVIEYQSAESTEWLPLTTITNEEVTRSHMYNYVWDISSLEAGGYNIRISVYDVSGNEPATVTMAYNIKSYSIPIAPILTAQSNGHKSIELSWSYGGDGDALASYSLYRSKDGINYQYVGGVSASTTEYTDVVSFSGESQKYYYKLTVRDKYDAMVDSQVVEVLAVSADSEAPIPVIGLDTFAYAAVGEAVILSGAASTDNDSIVSYEWNFGDGQTASGVETEHVYATAGDYKIQLKVTDAYGNISETTTSITVVDLNDGNAEYTKLEINVCDAITLKNIVGAEVSVGSGNSTEEFRTDSKGMLNCVVPNGNYTVSVCAEGYIVRTVSVEATGGITEHKIGMTNGSIMSGNLSAAEMSYDEIVAAGIDPNAEGNQHVYKFETTLTFVAGLQTYEIPYTIFKNATGKIIRDDDTGGFFTFEGAGGGVGTEGIKLGVFPISERFALVIYGEAHWLKEMYNVELVVLNHSKTDTLDQVVATLELPEGLSLADLNSGVQSSTQELGNIGYNEIRAARWYVRGDKEGEYNLTAKVSAVSMPYGEVIEQTFETTDTLKVYAGSALHLTITANDVAERGEQYPVTFRLENVSDKTLYNLSFGITGIEQFKLLRIGDTEGELLIDSEEFEDQFMRGISEFGPGEYIELEIDTTIWFNSIAEVGEKALKSYLNTKGLGAIGNFVDIAYYLDGVSVVALEGSTTEIPYSIVINEVKKPNILITAYETAKDIYKGETEPSTLMDTFVEVLGYDAPIYLQEGAKVLLSLPQGTTQYEVKISVSDGLQENGALRNEYISINSGTGGELIFDTLNSATIKTDDKGTFEINAVKRGEGEINLSIKDGKSSFNYRMPIIIDGEKIETMLGLSVDEKTGEYNINSDVVAQIIGNIREKERLTFEENPYLWFASHLHIDLKSDEGGLKNVLSLDDNTLEDLLVSTALSCVDVDSDIASLSIDRATLEQIRNSKSESEAVKIELKKLGGEVAEEKFGMDRPTYEFLIYVGEDASSKVISDFGEGEIEVEIPYELQEGEKAEDIEVQRVKEDGSYEVLPSQYYSAEGLVNFTTDQFSFYRIGLKNNSTQGDDTDFETESDSEESNDSTTENDSDNIPENSEVSSSTETSDMIGKTETEDKIAEDTTEESDVGSNQEDEQKNDGETENPNDPVKDGLTDNSVGVEEQEKDVNTVIEIQEIPLSSLNEEQLADIKNSDVVGVFSLNISNDGDGKVTVQIPFVFEEGAMVDDYSILSITKDGTTETIQARYEDGSFVFSVESELKCCVIVKNIENDISATDGSVPDKQENDIGQVWCIAVILIILAGIASAIIVNKKRKDVV